MKIQSLLSELGLAGETLYWGKRLVRSLPIPGAFKSHAVVINWNQPDLIRIDLRAGLTGKLLAGKDLAQYPLQLQSETFFELAVETDDDKGDTTKGKQGKSGSSGGGGLSKKRQDRALADHFASKHSEKIPTTAHLKRGVVMGMEIGQGALENVFNLFCQHVQHAKVLATDLLAAAGKAITRYTPPPFMAPRGDETKVYKYDRAKNEVMFGVVPT